MPIFWLTRLVIGGGPGVVQAFARQNRSMEMAAWWPCATAQMMFSGPQAASPPKKTPGRDDWKVVLVDNGLFPVR